MPQSQATSTSPAAGVAGTGHTAASNAIPHSLASGRVSYTLPAVQNPRTWLSLPPAGSPRRARSGPLLIPVNTLVAPATPPPRPAASPHPTHTLPVTSLALDTSTCIEHPGRDSHGQPAGLLYTAGRDGLAASWELGLKLRPANSAAVGSGAEEDACGDERDDRSAVAFERQWRVCGPTSIDVELPQPTFRQCIQSHTDWINDMLLCNMNQTVITASNDRTVKLWDAHAKPLDPHVLGTHSDYVKALSHARNAHWVASGGFDRVVKLWDVAETRPDPILQLGTSVVQASVYALSTDVAGSILAVGSPESVVRVLDPRSGTRVAQLVGHTDTVRSIMVSEDGRHLLSASSDATVRLWSLAEQRCLHTFTHHGDSVWSLASSDPNLEIFYSGDRQGYICKVDFQRCGEVAEGECVLLAHDVGHYEAEPRDSEDDVEQSARFRDAPVSRLPTGGIHRLAVQDDAYVWVAAGDSSVSCWKDVPSRSAREALYPIGAGSSYASRLLGRLPSSSPMDSDAGHGAQLTTDAAHLASPAGGPTSAMRSSIHTAGTRSAASQGVTFAAVEAQDVLPRNSISGAAASRHRPSHSQHSLNSIPDLSILGLPPSTKPSATLFGLPFASLVSLAPVSDPYGAAVGLGSISLRGSVASPIAASYAGAPYAGATNSSLRNLRLDGSRASLVAPNSAPVNPTAETSEERTPRGALRPGSLHSASIRFAPMHLSRDDLPGARASLDGLRSNDQQSGAMDDVGADDDEDEDAYAEDEALEARQAYEDRELASEARPLRNRPECVIEGSHGLVRSSMLNDRRHVLTVRTDGLVQLWDIVCCACLGAFDEGDVLAAAVEEGIAPKWAKRGRPADTGGSSQAATSADGAANAAAAADPSSKRTVSGQSQAQTATSLRQLPLGDVLELVKARIEGEGAMPLWCTIDTSAGTLSVHLEDPRCFDAEIYLDTCSDALDAQSFKEDQRVNLGKWILRSLFDGFVNAELRLRSGSSPPLRSGALAQDYPQVIHSALTPVRVVDGQLDKRQPLHIAIPTQNVGSAGAGETGGNHVATPGMTISLVRSPLTPARLPLGATPLTPSLRRTASRRTARGASVSSGANGREDYFGPATPGGGAETPTMPASPSIGATPSTGGTGGGSGFMGRLRMGIGSRSKERGSSVSGSGDKVQTDGKASEPTAEEAQLAARRRVLEGVSSAQTFTEAPPLPLASDVSLVLTRGVDDEVVYRGLVSSTANDVGVLESRAPLWLLEQLLANRTTPAGVKLSFVLVPWTPKTGAASRRGSAATSGQPDAAEEARTTGDGDGSAAAFGKANILGSSFLPLPELPSGNARLTASRMLRVRKVSIYVADKLGLAHPRSRQGSIVPFSSKPNSRRPSSDQSAAAAAAAAAAVAAAASTTSRASSSNGMGLSGAGRVPPLPPLPSSLNMTSTAPAAKGGVTKPAPSGDGPPAESEPPPQSDQPLETTAAELLEVVVNDVVVPDETTLLQVQRFYWKAGGDMRLEYRLRGVVDGGGGGGGGSDAVETLSSSMLGSSWNNSFSQSSARR